MSVVPTDSAWEPFEYDDGYPADEEFGQFDEVPLDFYRAAHWLISELPRAADNMPCFCDISDGTDSFWEKPVKVINFSTGGWSGAESLIGLINRRFDMRHFMLSWRRGGHYVFEIPERFLAHPSHAKAVEASASLSQSASPHNGEAPITTAIEVGCGGKEGE